MSLAVIDLKRRIECMENIKELALSSVIGYLAGSFLPGYFLPLWIKGIDIRKFGDGNPGVVNVKRNATLSIAVFTAFYDVLKGLFSLLITQYVLHFHLVFCYLSGFFAILGHRFPFYLKFKGGRGIATTVGLFLFMFVKLLIQNLTVFEIICFFCYISIYALLLNLATGKNGDFFTITAFPFICIFMALKVRIVADLIFFLVLSSIIVFEALMNLKRDGFKFYNEKQTFWRVILRPFALLFIPLNFLLPRHLFLLMLGIILSIFFITDLLRIIVPKIDNFFQTDFVNSIKFFKKKEEGKISSMTNFLLGVFLCFLLFDRNIAFASLGFVSLGDMFGKIVGINTGKTKIFKNSEKTLEGSLAFLSASVSVAFFLWIGEQLPIYTGLAGAIIATVVEMIPTQVDDNFSVSVISGAIMELVKMFLP